MAIDVLIIDDEKDIREIISDILRDHGLNTILAGDSESAIELMKKSIPSLVILDIWLEGSDMDGLGILESIKSKHPEIPVIMISGHGNIETAINSIKIGAYDYIEKPFKEDKLVLTVQRAIENATLKAENQKLKESSIIEKKIIGNSPFISNIRSSIDKISQSSVRVLIEAPAGSGKKVIARAIHEKSKSSSGEFVILKCSELNNENYKIEIFGNTSNWYDKDEKLGAIQRANRGTLYIEEIERMPLKAQQDFLNFLKEQEFNKNNNNSEKIKCDLRIISSTKTDLKNDIAKGNFLSDLYYRLTIHKLTIPPLSKRVSDIRDLSEYFVQRYSKLMDLEKKKLSEEVISKLEIYSWPGNVRQLKNIIEWLLIMSNNKDDIVSNDLPQLTNSDKPSSFSDEDLLLPIKEARENFERKYLITQLNRFGNNISKTANFIGMERSALHRKIKSLNIQQEDTQKDFAQ